LLALLPSLAARYVALGALREYHLVRWRRTRAVIAQAALAAESSADRALRAWPSYEPKPTRAWEAP
jgi:hypothetical protein